MSRASSPAARCGPATSPSRIPVSISPCPPARRSVPPGAGRSRRRAPTRRTDCSCSCGTRAGMKRCMGTPRAFWCEKAQGGLESESGLSIIGTGMRVVGDISADGVVKIEGTVVGTVRAGRQVLVGKGGEVEGDVISREAIIGGEVRGSIRADERIEIQSTSVVHGDIAAKRLLVQEGGEINGVVRMGEAALEAETAEKAGAPRSY